MHIRKTLPLVLGATLLVSACSDNTADTGVFGPTATMNTTLGTGTEATALTEITRSVALALQDQGLRQRIRNDMRASRFTAEHKLPFADYLNGNGGILLAKMAQQTGRSREDILNLLSQVRPLEFYMPVPEHRESWTGGDNLQVASLLEDHTVPAAFALNGNPLQLQAEVAPSTPTLAIVPVETNFQVQMQGQLQNAGDRNGQAIGTWTHGGSGGPSFMMIAPEEDGSGGGGGGGGYTTPTKPAGLYMTYSYITDDGEAWAKGAPELETHVHGQYTGMGTYGKDLSCAGEKMNVAYRNYNQDSRTWTGEVLLYTKSELDAYNAQFKEGFNVMVWEDDDTSCTLKTDKDIRGLLQLTAGVAAFAAVFVVPNPTTAVYITGFGTFIGSLYQNASWLLSNDDFIGDAVANYQGSPDHTLWNGGSNRGTIRLVTKYF